VPVPDCRFVHWALRGLPRSFGDVDVLFVSKDVRTLLGQLAQMAEHVLPADQSGGLHAVLQLAFLLGKSRIEEFDAHVLGNFI
jgi:hypothetical protein